MTTLTTTTHALPATGASSTTSHHDRDDARDSTAASTTHRCPICAKSFVRRDLRERHRRRCEKAQHKPRAPKKRSCESCIASKVRCDLGQPSCSRCKTRGTDCEYRIEPPCRPQNSQPPPTNAPSSTGSSVEPPSYTSETQQPPNLATSVPAFTSIDSQDLFNTAGSGSDINTWTSQSLSRDSRSLTSTTSGPSSPWMNTPVTYDNTSHSSECDWSSALPFLDGTQNNRFIPNIKSHQQPLDLEPFNTVNPDRFTQTNHLSNGLTPAESAQVAQGLSHVDSRHHSHDSAVHFPIQTQPNHGRRLSPPSMTDVNLDPFLMTDVQHYMPHSLADPIVPMLPGKSISRYDDSLPESVRQRLMTHNPLPVGLIAQDRCVEMMSEYPLRMLVETFQSPFLHSSLTERSTRGTPESIAAAVACVGMKSHSQKSGKTFVCNIFRDQREKLIADMPLTMDQLDGSSASLHAMCIYQIEGLLSNDSYVEPLSTAELHHEYLVKMTRRAFAKNRALLTSQETETNWSAWAIKETFVRTFYLVLIVHQLLGLQKILMQEYFEPLLDPQEMSELRMPSTDGMWNAADEATWAKEREQPLAKALGSMTLGNVVQTITESIRTGEVTGHSTPDGHLLGRLDEVSRLIVSVVIKSIDRGAEQQQMESERRGSQDPIPRSMSNQMMAGSHL